MSKPVLPNDTTGPAFQNDPSFPFRLVQCWVLSYTVCKMNLYDFISWCYVDVRWCKSVLWCWSSVWYEAFVDSLEVSRTVWRLLRVCHHAHSSQSLWRHSVLVVKWKTEIEHVRSWTQLYTQSKSIKYVCIYLFIYIDTYLFVFI